MLRIYVHVGVPKTGTTYLQDVLFRNRRELARAGVLYPAAYPEEHFDAVVDLRDMTFGGFEDPDLRGRWERLARSATRWRGHTVVLSHELLAGADADAVAAATYSLADHEVHVVLTARDLGQQVPAMWQEYVKNHSTVEFAAYAERLTRAPRKGKAALVFWRQQHIVEVLRRWSANVPDDRLHVVTVPPPGSEPALLWRRFAAAIGLSAEEYDSTPAARNSSLGFTETELLRRVNKALGDSLEWPAYEATVKNWFAEELLTSGQLSPRPVVPDELRPFFDTCARDMIDDLTTWGLPVEGALADLRPRWPDPATGTVEDDAVLDTAVGAVATLLRERADLHWTGRGGQLVRRARRSPAVRRLPLPVQEWLKRRANA